LQCRWQRSEPSNCFATLLCSAVAAHGPDIVIAERGRVVDDDLRAFYLRLIDATGGLRRGDWRLLDCHGWPDNDTARDLLAWTWHDDVPHALVVVNLSGHGSQARVPLAFPLEARDWRFTDLLDGRVFDRHGDELASAGLYVDLPPWGSHLLRVTPSRS